LAAFTITPPRKPLIAAVEGYALLLTGEQVTAARAAELGLVNRLVPDGAALDGALALAQLIAANGPLAVAVTKQIARAQADWTVTEGWQRQEKLYKPVFDSADAQEGAAAFADKRAPVWHGI
jgi:enoyl-CoA hydratase